MKIVTFLYLTSFDSLSGILFVLNVHSTPSHPALPRPQKIFEDLDSLEKKYLLESTKSELKGLEMLIVSRAPYCINGHCFVFYLF